MLSLYSRPSCHTWSKVCTSTRKTPGQNCFISKEDNILSVNLWIWWTVECFALKPNWEFEIILWVFIIGLILLSIIFSNSIVRVGSKLIGLYEVSRVFGLFGFGISITVDNFHIIGKYDSLSIALKIKVISGMGLRGRFFKTLFVIRS